MGQFKDAIDKQFPPKTDEQRAAFYAARRQRESGDPLWHSFVSVPLAFISAAFCFSPVLFFFWWMR